MSTWPLIAKNLVDQPTLDRLAAIFEEGIEAGVDGGRKTYHFKQLIAAGRKDIADRAVSAFAPGPADGMARQIFGGDYVFLLAACVYRCHEPYRRDTHLGLHFDANVFGQDALVVNFWIPFDTVGERAPGLTYIRSDIDVAPLVEQWRRSRLEPQAENGSGPKIRFSPDEVAATLGVPLDDVLFTPKLGPGDASIFHQFVIHGTQLIEVDEQPRRSFEMRVCAANKIPHAYIERGDPIVIARRTASGTQELEFRERATADG
ncbi:hypothetical protein [Thalassobaculum sp.]|uniref:hypothetical protein n=1 Tax=Thalassobaculum sp. TaxID=2022740 RepID=UPI003B5B1C98